MLTRKQCSDKERDAMDGNYIVFSDMVRIAKKYYPMDQQLHNFIKELCDCCGWPKEYAFQEILDRR